MEPISRQWPMLYATTKSTAASVASGMNRASGAKTSTTPKQRQRVNDAGHRRLRARAPMLVAVRAIAPVTGDAAKQGTQRCWRTLGPLVLRWNCGDRRVNRVRDHG